MKLNVSVLLLVLSLAEMVHAQQKFSISGYVLDSLSRENLIAVNIFDPDKKIGTTTNAYGFFSITLPEGRYALSFRYVGYHQKVFMVDLNEDKTFEVYLNKAGELNEAVITAVKAERIEDKSQMGQINIPMKQILRLPAFFGEVDVLKTLQLLPGVNPGVEGTSGLYVRGGSPDQNLILLDGVPLYNVSHLFGFFSVFNADAIQNVDLIKGGFPARYGGRLSSVLEINMREGDKKKFHTQGSIGAIASKIMVEGPLIKDKASFLITARRTYLDALMNPLLRATRAQAENQKQGYFFYDLNAKLNFKLGPKDHIYFSAYSGKDLFYNESRPYQFLYDGVIFENESQDNLGWGNQLAGFRWNHQINKRHFSNFQLSYTKYHYDVLSFRREAEKTGAGVVEQLYRQQFFSGIRDVAIKADFEWMPDAKHYVRYGANATRHQFSPGATAYEVKDPAQINNIDTLLGSSSINAWENYVYIEDDWVISEKIKANIGMHYSVFLVNGTFYHGLQPRFSGRWLMPGNWALKSSYAMMQQYIHLLTNNNIGLPTDLWVPTTERIRPEQSHQVSLGIAKTIQSLFECSVEGYYKHMDGIIDYVNGASFLSTHTDWQDKVERGKGRSMGLEVFVQKKYGRTQGWISYTLSKTDRIFPTINYGQRFPFKYDNRHTASLAITHDLKEKKWKLGMVWVYASGNAVTLANVRYLPGDFGEVRNFYRPEIESFSERNGFRAADYHRLDLSAQRTWFLKKGAELGANFSIYNTYSRKNPFYYRFDTDFYGNRVLKRIALFPILPSLALNFKF